MSYLALESESIPLARPEYCATWTTDAKTLFNRGIRSWVTVLQAPQLALQHFHHVSGADATVYVATHDWSDVDNRPGTLVSLYFATDAAISKADLGSLGRPLEQSDQGWSNDGIHAAPAQAFPLLSLRRGEIFHVWVHDEEGTLTAHRLVSRGNRAKDEILCWGEAEHSAFIPSAKHAKGAWTAPHDAERQHRDQLKLAFAYKIAERVVEADGVVDDDERAFLVRTFPPEQLEELWLDDPALRDTLASQAETELKDQLGYHEKLGLLSSFFAACYADGRVQVQELQVLRDASLALGLDKSEVVTYLRKLW